MDEARTSLSFPRLLDTSDRMPKAVGASLHVCFWLMSRSRRKAAVLMLRAGTKAHRAHRRLRRKEARLVPARETSEREVCFLCPNGRYDDVERERRHALRFNRRANRRVLVKWKILGAH